MIALEGIIVGAMLWIMLCAADGVNPITEIWRILCETAKDVRIAIRGRA